MRRRALLAGLAAGGVTIATGLASPEPAAPQVSGPVMPAPVPPPMTVETGTLGSRMVLDNGLVLLVAERRGLPIVQVRASVAAGAVLDPPDRAGLASLTAELLVRGTVARSGGEIDRAIEAVGGTLWAEAGRDAVEVGVAVLRHDLALGLDLLADVLQHPVFPADEVDRERAEAIAAVRRSEEDPAVVAGRAMRRLVFAGHPYAQPIDGTEESLARISRDDLVAFHQQAYGPGSLVVAVAGDVSVEEARRAVESRLGQWVGGPPSPGAGPVALGRPSGTETIQRELTQATIELGQATVTRAHPDFYALEVASQVLGGGSSSRLTLRIREERGLAYAVGSSYLPGRLAGLFLVDAQTENAHAREVLSLVRTELVRIRRERVPEDELGRARAYLVGRLPLEVATTGQVADLLVGVERQGLTLDYPERYRRGIEAVTADDVLRAVRTHWDPDRMSLVVVGNLREAGLVGP